MVVTSYIPNKYRSTIIQQLLLITQLFYKMFLQIAMEMSRLFLIMVIQHLDCGILHIIMDITTDGIHHGIGDGIHHGIRHGIGDHLMHGVGTHIGIILGMDLVGAGIPAGIGAGARLGVGHHPGAVIIPIIIPTIVRMVDIQTDPVVIGPLIADQTQEIGLEV